MNRDKSCKGAGVSHRAFTLIELLAIVAIIGIMVSVAIMGVGSGQRIARLRGATRDVFATIRQARSVALVSQQPSIVTYSSVMKDGEVCARVVLDSVKLISESKSSIVETLSGEKVDLADPTGAIARENSRKKSSIASDEEDDESEEVGEAIEDILFAPVDEEVFRGIAIKVIIGDELEAENEEVKHLTLSAFSNADSILGKYKDAKKESEKNQQAANDESVATNIDIQEPVRVVWEPNGRCEPHKIWVYCEGSDPESGLAIVVDRFGAAKVLDPRDAD